MGQKDPWFDHARQHLKLEHGLLLGASIILAGIILIITIILDWVSHGLGSLAQEHTAILATTLLVLGIQITFSSFLLSIPRLRKTQTTHNAKPTHMADSIFRRNAQRGTATHVTAPTTNPTYSNLKRTVNLTTVQKP